MDAQETSTAPQEPSSAPQAQRDPSAGVLSPHERRERLLERIRRAADPSPPDGQKAQDAPGAADRAPVERVGSTGAAEPAERPEKREKTPSEDLELRVSRMQRDLRDARADALEARETVTKYKALSEKIERAKTDAYAAVNLLPELFGRDFGQLADFVVQNEQSFRQQQKYAQLPPDVREELELAKRERLEREARQKTEAEQQKRQQQFTSYRDTAQRYIEEHREDFPLSHAVGWAADQIARDAIQRGTRDALPMLEHLEKGLRAELSKSLGNADVLRSLLQSEDQETVEKLRSALGAALGSGYRPASSPRARAESEAPVEGPASLSNARVTSDTSNYQTLRDERKKRIALAFKQTYGSRTR